VWRKKVKKENEERKKGIEVKEICVVTNPLSLSPKK